jgi:hypothetical protein
MMGKHRGIPMIDEKDEGYYDHLNKEPLVISIDMDALAKLVDGCNYGSIRFLAALVRVRRVRQAERITEYEERGDDDIARYAKDDGDALMNGLIELLKTGAY